MSNPWEDPRVIEGLRRQLDARSDALSGGAEHVGWKVGFGAPASLELMQITAPLLGYLTDATVFERGAVFDTGDWARGVVEFEVAVWMGSDLGPGAGDAEAAAAVAAVGPAIEVADVDLPVAPDRVSDIMAGDIFHRGVVFGERDTGRAGLDISEMTARISIDDVEQALVTELEAITGSYPWIVSTVASTLASAGERLRAGDVIITGSVIPPVSVSAGHEFTFTLDPLAPISIKAN
jgi:2-keto-4-pentenoate hydratase